MVIDEMPYLIQTDPGFEGTLQKIFDRELSRKPVLLICVGSDLAMMEALNSYGRPFHQRATVMVVPPLSPADAEFPEDSHARAVLSAIGAGEVVYTKIQQATGGMAQATLNRALRLLTDKRIIDASVPLSTHPSRERRYSVADPHLRYWLAFIGRHMAEIERGRGDLLMRRVKASWPKWRGVAVELPGADGSTPLAAVSRSGMEASGPLTFGPDDLMEAWR